MRRIIAFALFAGLLGCSSDNTSAPAAAFVGSYTLVSVNSQPLPATITQTAVEKDEILSGTTTLNANGTYSGVITYRQTVLGATTTIPLTTTGTWTRSGDTFTLTDTSGQSSTATYSNGKLTASVTATVVLTLVFQHN